MHSFTSCKDIYLFIGVFPTYDLESNLFFGNDDRGICLQIESNVTKEVPVCVGSEWHRFPSSFFLPSAQYKLQFVKSGFTGLLPRAFDLHEASPHSSTFLWYVGCHDTESILCLSSRDSNFTELLAVDFEVR